MTELVMLVGIAGSGKSTYASSHYKNHIIHSSDNLRKELYGDESVQCDNEGLFKELHNRIKNDLKNGNSVVYDATNLSYKRRKAFINELGGIECFKTCVVIACPIEKCIKRNNNRGRKVPEDVIYNMRKRFCFPCYFEGWDKIEIIHNYNNEDYPSSKFDEFVKQATDFNQDNPNHKYSLYNHLYKTEQYIEENYNGVFEVLIAGFLHDIGKLYTKTFINQRGEETDIAHYYNHNNVSAYESMFLLKNCIYVDNEPYSVFCDEIEVCSLIQWHMQPYFNNTEYLKEKYKKLWGDLFDSKLMILHEADNFAH